MTTSVVDSHVHLWDPRRFRMAWLDGNELLDKPYGPAEYAEHTRNVAVEAFVYLEVDVAPNYGLLEARWAVERAKQDARLRGIVAHAPVDYGEQVRAYLDELVTCGPLIKGVRRLIQSEPDPRFAAQPRFVKGVQILADYGLSFDACLRHTQLPAVIELARQCPRTSIIVDHLAKPAIGDKVLDPWRSHMRELAGFPNVVCKVSGAITEARPDWTVDDLRPYIEHVIEVFGPERVLFGGDWPVVLMNGSYQRWADALEEITSHASEDARRKLWGENARRVYRL
ncbi:MAG: amidohydrolase family protein [Chloroflexi bacterium]|nr:amidohydrolase family protein [Chloroflexota bacterium]